MRSIAALFLAASVALVAGCSSQSSSASNSNTQTTASAAAANGGCDVDVNQICESMRNKPIDDAGTGLSLDSRALAERSARTTRTFANVPIPNGSTLQIGCEMNAQHDTVTYAHLLRGAALTPTDVAWLKAQHLCK